MTQAEENLPGKCEALSSDCTTTKKGKAGECNSVNCKPLFQDSNMHGSSSLA
jgi:hypothetical protein